METVNLHVPEEPFCCCQQCLCDNVLIEQSVQFIPTIYPVVNKSHKDKQFERRIHKTLKQFTEKYSLSRPDQSNELKEKLKKMRKKEPHTKGLKQSAAVVVYMSVRGQLRQTFKEFCKQNSLNLKICNRKYKVYHSLFEVNENVYQEMEGYEQSIGIKVEQRMEGPKYSNIYEVLNESQYANYEPKNINTIETVQVTKTSNKVDNYINPWFRAIDSIFDSLFKGYYFKSNKSSIIQKLIEKLETIKSLDIQNSNTYQNGPQVYYYILFATLKHFRLKITFHSFNQILKKEVGYSLSRKKAIQIKKTLAGHFRQIQQHEGDESERHGQIFAEIHSVKKEMFRARDEIYIQESPLILQEELFSFDNCYYLPNDNDSFG